MILINCLQQKWNDCRLTWNEAEYDNIKSFAVMESLLWVPDIVMYDR